MKSKPFISVIGLLVASLSLSACADNGEDKATNSPTASASTTTKQRTWDDLSTSEKEIHITEAQSQGLSALIWGEHVEWINGNYPAEQKKWIEEQVKEFAHTDAPVKSFFGLGDAKALKVTREYTDSSHNPQSVDITYRTATPTPSLSNS